MLTEFIAKKHYSYAKAKDYFKQVLIYNLVAR